MNTTKSNSLELDQQLTELSKGELLIIKATIVLFGMTLNICCLHLLS